MILIVDKGKSPMTFISLGLAAILIASSLLRGTYYPVYQHTIFMLVAVLFIIAFTRWGLNGVGQGIGSITIWVVLLAVVSISSSLWSAAPILSVSNIFIYIAFALFQLLFSRTWQGTVYKHKPGVEFWLLGFAIMGALVSLTGIIGALLQIYPWSMAVDGVIVASSCLEYPNGLAIYALMALAPTLYLRSITAGHRERWFITGLATLQVGGILLAFSKTGLLFLAILTVYIFTRTRAGTIRLKHFVIAGGVLVVLASIILVGTVNSGGI
ncbi:MAG TPA: hypothetical protein VE439_11760, partial [Anaerolineae bacterium]|nr:hypothetical protein [Anaerolineae bacterium]